MNSILNYILLYIKLGLKYISWAYDHAHTIPNPRYLKYISIKYKAKYQLIRKSQDIVSYTSLLGTLL